MLAYKPAVQIAHKQRSGGLWGRNVLGVVPLKSEGIKDAGTIAQYRRLLEMGWTPAERPLRSAERLLYRLLSRDDDPRLLHEHKTRAKKDPAFGAWARELERQGAACALAHAGHSEDPRLRGAAHRIATQISHFLRSGLAQKPLLRSKGRTVLHPEAKPPTIFSVSMIAHLPSLQRERATFVERLAEFLAQHPPKRPYSVLAGKRYVKPQFLLLGDPIQATTAGAPADLPLALLWMELLARMGALTSSTTAQRVLASLLKHCDDQGVWSPKNLRSIPKGSSRWPYHAFPLEAQGKTLAQRQSDVTFRLALIAKLSGWSLEIV